MSGHWVKVTEIRVRCDLQKASSDAMAPVAVALPLFNSSKTRSDPCTVFASLRCKNLHMTGTRVHAIIPGFHAVRRSGLGDVDAAIGTAWSPALGAPIRITRSREFDEVALLSFARPVSPLFRDGIPPILPSPSASQTRPLRRGDYVLRPKQCLKAETQNVPIRFASSPLHLRSVVAFHGARYLREHVRPWAWHRPSGRPRQP